MSDADWFSPYAHPRALRHEGEVRGYHLTQRVSGSGRFAYLARLELKGPLPRLGLRPRGLPFLDRVFGPVLDVGQLDIDRHFVVRSEGYELPSALFGERAGEDPLSSRLVELKDALESVEILGDDERCQLLVDVVLGPNNAYLQGGMHLALALLACADRLVEEGRTFRNAWQVLTGSRGPIEPSPEKLEELTSFIAQTTDWVTGHVARVKDTVEGRLLLADAGAELEGTLYLAWRDAHMRALDVELQAALPSVRGPEVSLEKKRGLVGFLRSLTELEVGDRALDEAFLVEGEPSARRFLLDAKEPLLTLGRYGAKVRVAGATLHVLVGEVPFEPLPLRAILESALLLWRRATLFRAGFHADREDPTAL